MSESSSKIIINYSIDSFLDGSNARSAGAKACV
jgi:hypothetical protein